MALTADILQALAEMPENAMFVAGGFIGLAIAVAAMRKMNEATGEGSAIAPGHEACAGCGEVFPSEELGDKDGENWCACCYPYEHECEACGKEIDGAEWHEGEGFCAECAH